MLRPVCREITDNDKEEYIEKLLMELLLPEKDCEELAEKKETSLYVAYIKKAENDLGE